MQNPCHGTTSHRRWLWHQCTTHPLCACVCERERMHIAGKCLCVYVCTYRSASPLLIHLIRGNRPQTRGISRVFDLLFSPPSCPSPFPFYCLERKCVFSAHININWALNVGRATTNCPLWNLPVFANTPEQRYRRDWGATCRAGTDWGLIYPPYETPPPPPYSPFPLLPFLLLCLISIAHNPFIGLERKWRVKESGVWM